MASSDRDLEADFGLGTGWSRSIENGDTNSFPYSRQVNSGVLNPLPRFNETIEGEKIVSSESRSLLIHNEVAGRVELVIDQSTGEVNSLEQMALLEKKVFKEKRKSKSKKAPKPPLAPKGPSLDAADVRLIKELSDLAMGKRMRIQQMKELKKIRAAKAQASKSSNSILVASIVTAIFCLVMFLHGINSKSGSTTILQGSPQLDVPSSEDLISIQLPQNLSPLKSNEPEPQRASYVEQIFSSAPIGVGSRDVGRGRKYIRSLFTIVTITLFKSNLCSLTQVNSSLIQIFTNESTIWLS